MKIKLKKKYLLKILKRLSKISNTAILDFSLIYLKYNKDQNLSQIIYKISGNNPEIELNLIKLIPFQIDLLKRIKSYPISYITKNKDFYESAFYVEKGVLIPRPESEILVDCAIFYTLNLIKSLKSSFNLINLINYNKVIDAIPKISYGKFSLKAGELFKTFVKSDNKNNTINFCELCSGSGAISISIIKKIAEIDINSKAFCVDISKKANKVAKKNTEFILKEKKDRIKLIRKDIFKFNFNAKFKNYFDFIIANPPYIDKEDYKRLCDEVRKYEPKKALVCKKKQNAIYKRIAEIAKVILKENGMLAVEVSDSEHAKEVAEIFKNNGFISLIIADLKGIGRVVLGQDDGIQNARA